MPEPSVGLLLSTALRNALIDAKTEGDLARRDALLDELPRWPAPIPMMRSGASDWPRVCTTYRSTPRWRTIARPDALLDELRALARTRPNDAAVRERC